MSEFDTAEKSAYLPVKQLVLPSFNVRLQPDRTVETLVESVKADGVLEPLIVRPMGNDMYEVVCGSRRLQAAVKAGLQAVPCIVKAMSDEEAFEAMLVENMQRENLSDYEVGRWFKMLMEKFPEKYPNQQAVADRFHVNQSYVSLLISHYEFIEKCRKLLPDDAITMVISLPERVVREVRRAPEPVQAKILEKTVRQGLTFQGVCEEVGKAVVTVQKLRELEVSEKAAVEAEKFAAHAPLEQVTAKLQEHTAKKKEAFEQLLDRLSKYYPLNVLDDVLTATDLSKGEEKIISRLRDLFEFEHQKIKEKRLLDEVFAEMNRWR